MDLSLNTRFFAYVEKNYNKEKGELKWLCKEDYFAPAANLFKSCKAYVGTTLLELETGHKLVKELWRDNYSGYKGKLSFQYIYKQLGGDEKKNVDNGLEIFDQILSTFEFFQPAYH